jgi:hypothetical protein
MTQTRTTSTQSTGDVPNSDTRTTRIGAALGVASIVLIAVGLAISGPMDTTITAPEGQVVAFYRDSNLAGTLAGGFIEVLGLTLLLPFVAMLAARVRTPGNPLAPTARMAATVYVALSLAPGMAAGGTALWLAHHRTVDDGLLLALNDLRAMSHFVSLVPYAVFLVAVGIAGRSTHRLPAWAAWSAIVFGAALAVSTPVAASGATDFVGLATVLWVLAVGVALLRHPEPGRRVTIGGA